MSDPESIADLRAEILLLRREVSKLLQIALSEFADAERWRYARQHSYIEVRCDSPRVDGWAPELLDVDIDKAREALAAKGSISSKSTAAEGQWMGEDDPPPSDPPAAPCANIAHMGKFACANRHQCFEPCGELGHDPKYARRAPVGPLYAILDQRQPQAENSSDAWISVTDRLPSTEPLPNGDAPVVLAAWKKGKMADNLLQVTPTNTTFLALRVSDFTHWMPIPPTPLAAK